MAARGEGWGVRRRVVAVAVARLDAIGAVESVW